MKYLIFVDDINCIIKFMKTSERMISESELKQNNGERGKPKYIAYNGIVYDVSDCPRWKKELHQGLHFPGQDLSGEIEEAPHGEDVFTRPCVKIVGKLQSPGE